MCRTVNKRRSLALLFKLWWWCNCGCVFSRKKTCCNCWPREEVAVEMLRTSLLLFFRENCHTQNILLTFFHDLFVKLKNSAFCGTHFRFQLQLHCFVQHHHSLTIKEWYYCFSFNIIYWSGQPGQGSALHTVVIPEECEGHDLVPRFRIRIYYYADPDPYSPYFSPFGSGSGEGDLSKTSQIKK